MGSLGAALGTMVANLSAHKPGWDDRWEYFSQWAAKGQEIVAELMFLVDEDTNAFNRILEAFSMPKSTDAEKALRTEAIQAATQYATEIPLRTMRVAYSAFDLLEAMVKDGNPNSLSDAGVGALAIRAAVYGAYMNVLINSADLKDIIISENLKSEAEAIFEQTREREDSITDSLFKTLKSR